MPAATARWLGAHNHRGHNTGPTDTHCIFVLKEPPRISPTTESVLGPTTS